MINTSALRALAILLLSEGFSSGVVIGNAFTIHRKPALDLLAHQSIARISILKVKGLLPPVVNPVGDLNPCQLVTMMRELQFLKGG